MDSTVGLVGGFEWKVARVILYSSADVDCDGLIKIFEYVIRCTNAWRLM